MHINELFHIPKIGKIILKLNHITTCGKCILSKMIHNQRDSAVFFYLLFYVPPIVCGGSVLVFDLLFLHRFLFV